MSYLNPNASAFVPSTIKLNAVAKSFVPQAPTSFCTKPFNGEAAPVFPSTGKSLESLGIITAKELPNPSPLPEVPPEPKASKSPKPPDSHGALKPTSSSSLRQVPVPLNPVPSKVPTRPLKAKKALPNQCQARLPMYTKRLSGHEIRLLQILPGKDYAQIECNLEVYKTDKLPPYEALSYVWGTSAELKPMLCDGHYVDVTPNLLCALKQLRYKNKERLVWIDYVCINQNDNDEKTEQVQLMKTIYSEAWRVVVSIAYEHFFQRPKETIEAIELMERLQGARRSIESAVTMPDEVLAGPEPAREKWDREASDMLRKLRAFLEFIRDDWFTRIWCVQEIVLAQDAVLLLGSSQLFELRWKRIMPLIPWLLEQEVHLLQEWGEEQHKAARSVHDTLITTRYNLKTDPRGLLYALSDFRHRKATNPRDKVYALLGLIDWKHNDSSLIPNYNKGTTFDVYFDAAKSIIETTGDLSLLAAAGLTDPDYPSWVPLWNLDGPLLDVRLLNVWSACGDHRAGKSAKIIKDTLHNVGRKFDTVDHAGALLEQPRYEKLLKRFPGSDEDATHQVLELWLKIHQDNRPTKQDRESQIRSMAITLIHGLIEDQQPVYENTESALNMGFLTFMKSMLKRFENNLQERFIPKPFTNYTNDEWEAFLDPNYESMMESHRKTLYGLYGRYQDDTSIPTHDDFTETPYARLAEIRLRGRRIFYTSEGYFGIGPASMQKDDVVVVLDRATIPYVLRPTKNPWNEYKLIGSCYIHDVMDGKWYASSSASKREKFILR